METALDKVCKALLAKSVGQFFMFFLFNLSAAFRTVDDSVLLKTLSFLGFGDTKAFQLPSRLPGFWLLLTGTLLFLYYSPAALACFLFLKHAKLVPPAQCLCTSCSLCLVATWRFFLIVQLKYHDLIESLTSLSEVTPPPHPVACLFYFFHTCISVLNPYLWTCLLFVVFLRNANPLRAKAMSVATWSYPLQQPASKLTSSYPCLLLFSLSCSPFLPCTGANLCEQQNTKQSDSLRPSALASWIASFWGSQLPFCEVTQAAISGEELKPLLDFSLPISGCNLIKTPSQARTASHMCPEFLIHRNHER